MTLDDLLGPVPEGMIIKTEDDVEARPYFSKTESAGINMSSSAPSKVQRVREYLNEHPDTKNKDVVEHLKQYGVTGADVANARTRMKKEGAKKPPKSKSNIAPSSAPVRKDSEPEGQIAMKELNAGMTFIRQVGSLDRARQLLVIIEQIQKV